MNNIQIFNNNSFGELRVIENDGKVWFCLSDVCKALELKIQGKWRRGSNLETSFQWTSPLYQKISMVNSLALRPSPS